MNYMLLIVSLFVSAAGFAQTEWGDEWYQQPVIFDGGKAYKGEVVYLDPAKFGGFKPVKIIKVIDNSNFIAKDINIEMDTVDDYQVNSGSIAAGPQSWSYPYNLFAKPLAELKEKEYHASDVVGDDGKWLTPVYKSCNNTARSNWYPRVSDGKFYSNEQIKAEGIDCESSDNYCLQSSKKINRGLSLNSEVIAWCKLLKNPRDCYEVSTADKALYIQGATIYTLNAKKVAKYAKKVDPRDCQRLRLCEKYGSEIGAHDAEMLKCSSDI